MGPVLRLAWIDGATDVQEPFEGVLSITPTDRAGNTGPPAHLPIADGGTIPAPAGCSSASLAPVRAWLLGGIVLLATRRRAGAESATGDAR